MADQIKAIQTKYKGYNFRSRLEARWAVFFDALKIEWAYEEEGFSRQFVDCGGCTCDVSDEKVKEADENFQDVQRVNYLPDFRIGRPGSGIFVEVKGDKSQLTKNRDSLNVLHDWGGILPSFQDSFEHCRGLILLGEIPFADQKTVFHPIVQHRKGVWKSYCVFMGYSQFLPLEVIKRSVISSLIGCNPQYECDWDASHKTVSLGSYYSCVNSAYLAARSARFEHGENGAT